MIAYRILLTCDGCRETYRPPGFLSLPLSLHTATLKVQKSAEGDGWLTDGPMHYCPKCQVQRKAG